MKHTAYAKAREVDDEVTAEIEAQYEIHRARLGDLDVERLLKTGAAGPSGTASSQASTSSRATQYKPQDTFLDQRSFLGGGLVIPQLLQMI